MRAWKTRRCSAPKTAVKAGRSSLVFAGTAQGPTGNRVRAACACIPSFSIRRTRGGSSSPFRPRGLSAPMTAARPGGRSIADSNPHHIPDPEAEVGHCVHHIAMHPSRPGVLFMQKHWDVMRSDNAGDSWEEVSGNLPTDFGFAIDVHAHQPETIYVVPIKSDSEHYPAGWQTAGVSQPNGRKRVGAVEQRFAANATVT